MAKGAIRILSLEAKDIVTANYAYPKKGCIIYKDDGALNLNKFSNTLDWSLDRDKLEEACLDQNLKYRKSMVEYKREDGKQYSLVVINVEFHYNAKEFNKVDHNTFVRYGCAYSADKLNDCAYVDTEGKLIAIQTGVQVSKPLDKDILGKNFKYDDKKGTYCQIGEFDDKLNTSELRYKLYKEGFDLYNGKKKIHYVRYKRSAGSARDGKCLFVDKRLSSAMEKWDKCGLKISGKSKKFDLASWEAYIALTMSGLIDTIEIKPENILLVDDYISSFDDTVIAVEQDKKTKELVATEKEVKISNNIWDGESLLDSSVFAEKGYEKKGMLVLRNRFFKTCAFNTNIQMWFKDNNITSVGQLNGFTRATDIKQIKLITTPSSLKFLKFGNLINKKTRQEYEARYADGSAVFQYWLDNIDSTFGIVKHEKKTSYFGGRLVRANYQLLNTLNLDWSDIRTILEPSFKYINAVRTDPVVLRTHIKYSLDHDEEYGENDTYKSKYDILYDMLGLNDKFYKTQLYYDFRQEVVDKLRDDLRDGHVLFNGNNSTLLCNGIELLKQAIGKFGDEDKENPMLAIDPETGFSSVRTTRFKPGTEILCERSPHITMGNLLLAKNAGRCIIDDYFNLTKEIIYINAIKDNILNRLNGADMDSDAVLITDDKILVDTAKVNYQRFKVPTAYLDSKNQKRKYNAAGKAELDIMISNNQVGEIVNKSQILNSRYWDFFGGFEPLSEIDADTRYLDICKLAVLSGIEIDKAKKDYNIDSAKEIEIINKRYFNNYHDSLKPIFFLWKEKETKWADPGKKKEAEDSILHKYKPHNTPMDYLMTIVNEKMRFNNGGQSVNTIPFEEVIKEGFRNPERNVYKIKKEIADKEERKEVLTEIKTSNDIVNDIIKCKNEIKKARSGYSKKNDEEKSVVNKEVERLKKEYIDKIDSDKEYLLSLVLKKLAELSEKKDEKSAVENKETTDTESKAQKVATRKLLFEIIFRTPKKQFWKMIDANITSMEELVEDENGDEEYYGIKFKRVKITRYPQYRGFFNQNE